MLKRVDMSMAADAGERQGVNLAYDGIFEGVLGVEDDHIGTAEEVPAGVDAVDFVDVELAVAGED